MNPATPSQLSGTRFGSLTAVAPTEKRNHNGTILWLVRCDCGKEKQVPSTKLVSGEVKSCSCQEHIRGPRTHKGHSGLNSLLKRYHEAARKRGLPFLLTLEQFEELTSDSCTYCGIAPHREIYGSRGACKEHGKYVHNGIDRVDSKIGYTPDNCVSCCKTCNLAKHTMTTQEFLNWIQRVYEFNFTNT